MDTIDLSLYRKAKENIKNTEELLKDLDKIGKLLYNNIKYGGVWSLTKDLERIRYMYIMRYNKYLNEYKNLYGRNYER